MITNEFITELEKEWHAAMMSNPSFGASEVIIESFVGRDLPTKTNCKRLMRFKHFMGDERII